MNNRIINIKNILFKISFFIFLILSINLSAQQISINLNMENVSLSKILSEVKKQSGKSILFNNGNVISKYDM